MQIHIIRSKLSPLHRDLIDTVETRIRAVHLETHVVFSSNLYMTYQQFRNSRPQCSLKGVIERAVRADFSDPWPETFEMIIQEAHNEVRHRRETAELTNDKVQFPLSYPPDEGDDLILAHFVARVVYDRLHGI